MADAAPVVPAVETPAAPPPGATVTPIKPAHHSATQPREVGKFAGPPVPEPKTWDLGGRKVTDPDEVYAFAREREVDAQAYAEARQETERLRAEVARWKEPSKALTREQREAIALQELQEHMRAQEEAKLPPEQRAFLQRQRELEAKLAKYEEEKAGAEQRAQQEAAQADRANVVDYMKAALAHLGDTNGDPKLAREVLFETRRALVQGKQYPPDVLARQVQRRLDAEAARSVARLPVARVLAEPTFVDALNKLEDPALLAKLGPLLERARLHNLQSLGAKPAAPHVATAAPALPPGQEPRTTEQWVAYFRNGGQRDTPERNKQFNTLKDRGLL